VAVVACDMPFANATLLRAAAALLTESTADAAVPRTPAGWEPLHAIYRRETCLPLIRQALDEGRWKVTSWFDQARILPLEPNWCRRFDPDGLAFWNLNTPDDLRAAEQCARAREPR